MVSVKVMVENDKPNKYQKMNSKTVVWISLEITGLVEEEIEWLDCTDAVQRSSLLPSSPVVIMIVDIY